MTLRINRSTIIKNSLPLLLIFLGIGGSVVLAFDVAVTEGMLVIAIIASCMALILAYFIPEIPLVILTVGMLIWRFVPLPIEFTGVRIVLTVLLAIAFVALRCTLFRDEVSKRIGKINICAADVAVSAFCLWLWLGLLWTPNLAYGQFKASGFSLYTFGGYLAIRWGYSVGVFDIDRLAKLMALAGGVHFVLAIRASAASNIWDPVVRGRRFDVLNDWNFSIIANSDSLTLTLICTLWLIFSVKSRLTKILLSIFFFLQLWAFAIYQQRGATIALLISTMLIILVLKPGQVTSFLKRKKDLYQLLGIAAILIIGLVLYRYNPQFDISLLSTDSNVVGRLARFQIGWNTFIENPIIGVGTGGTGSEFGYESDRSYVHNRILEIMSELGLVGLALFMTYTGLFVTYFWRTISSFKARKAVYGMSLAGACLLARYTVGMSSSDLVGWNIGLWAGLLVSIYQTIDKKNTPQFYMLKLTYFPRT